MSVQLRYVPCSEFELRIHAFVDGEIRDAEAQTLLVHLELCGDCRSTVDLLRRQVRAHRDAVDLSVVEGFDSSGFLRRLQGRLVRENLGRLAELLYQIGKAYFVAGNDSRLRLYLHKKAIALERGRAEGRRVLRETEKLAVRAGTGTARRRLERAGRLLRSRALRSRSGFARRALEDARRFLGEALALRPDHVPARIVHAMVLVRSDRLDEAEREYRRLLRRGDLTAEHRVLVLQHLGNLHGMRREYEEAVRTYLRILELGLPEGDPRFFHVLVGLAMFQAKAGDLAGSKTTFDRLVRDFPRKLDEARAILDGAQVFRDLLASRSRFHRELRSRYPMLFAG